MIFILFLLMQTESKAAAPATPNSKSNVSFVPLGGEASTPSQQPSSFSAASTPSLGFVFGQNIHEKVVSIIFLSLKILNRDCSL